MAFDEKSPYMSPWEHGDNVYERQYFILMNQPAFLFVRILQTPNGEFTPCVGYAPGDGTVLTSLPACATLDEAMTRSMELVGIALDQFMSDFQAGITLFP